jgi:hypothetical protein
MMAAATQQVFDRVIATNFKDAVEALPPANSTWFASLTS